jgi:histone deacetylase 11
MWSVVAGSALLIAGAAWFTRAPRAAEPQSGAVVGDAVVVYSPGYRISLYGIEKLHPFDIGKLDRIASHLVDEGLVPADGFAVPEEASEELLGQVHDPDYIASLHDPATLGRALEVSVPGFIGEKALDKRVLTPFRRSVGGTVLAAQMAIEHGVGINLGGGFHHAQPDMGHGFCIYNDVATAIFVLREQGFEGNILIVDTDAHQGDGDHAFFADDDSVFSFSMHQGNIFPDPKVPGDRDLNLPSGTNDADFNTALGHLLTGLLDEQQPTLVFHVAGSDVLSDDPLAGMAMTVDGLVERDELVYAAVRDRDIPLVHVLAGGYGPSSAQAQSRSVARMLRAGL